jgi:oxygen-independent coproporphyrinogen-3 oxidase
MAGIYIHIPFCKSRCIYCAFYSTTADSERQRYVDAVCREMVLRGTRNEEKIETIYLGGGTPSQLTPAQLRQIFIYINKVFHISPSSLHLPPYSTKEITIECNPDDISPEYATALSELGVNRVSMGAQTFDDCRLQFLHRRHSAAQVSTAVQRLRQAGISNISIDLMYGFPGETLDDWQHDIDAALALDVEHISAYCLMIEEGTPLYQKLHKRNGPFCVLSSETTQEEPSPVCDEELERTMYYTLIDRLTAAGYKHYEISNFAHPGFRSRHNSSYWTDVPYIGLGAAAHSYDGHRRRWNVSDLWQYIKGIEEDKPLFEEEEIDGDTRYNDRLTVALRTCEGLCLNELSERQRDYLLHATRRYVDDGLLVLADNHLRLSRKGLFVSDMILADLMLVDD